MEPIYAIGDVHGQFEMLADALERIEDDGGPDSRVVVLGDLVDRGPDSFSTVELLRLGIEEGRDWTVLRGNHDQMFLDFLSRGAIQHPRMSEDLTWLNPRLGGLDTLASYGVDVTAGLREMRAQAIDLVPQSHIEFLSNLPLVYETGPYLFVHAGVRPDRALEEQNPEDLMWIRKGFLDHDGAFEWLVVHGHTALEAPQDYGNRINLDGGAGYGRDLGVCVLNGLTRYLLTAQGRSIL